MKISFRVRDRLPARPAGAPELNTYFGQKAGGSRQRGAIDRQPPFRAEALVARGPGCEMGRDIWDQGGRTERLKDEAVFSLSPEEAGGRWPLMWRKMDTNLVRIAAKTSNNVEWLPQDLILKMTMGSRRDTNAQSTVIRSLMATFSED